MLENQPLINTRMYVQNSYLLNWEAKDNFALKMDDMGSFILYKLLEKAGPVKLLFQDPDSEGLSPSRRSCFSLSVP